MQIVAAGLSIAAQEKKIPVTLAGGTQMIAVKALIDRLVKCQNVFEKVHMQGLRSDDERSLRGVNELRRSERNAVFGNLWQEAKIVR